MTLAQRRAKAYELLGVAEPDVLAAPQVSRDLRRTLHNLASSGMPTDPMHYLKSCGEADARMVVHLWRELPNHLRRIVPLEALCLAAKVDPLRVSDLVVMSITRISRMQSTVIAAMSHPEIVDTSVRVAKTDEGVADRMAIHKAVGFTPSPKGTQTIVQVTQTASAAAGANALSAPPPEQTIRRLSDRLNALRGALPPAVVPTQDHIEEAELVEVESDEGDDE
jgi:hypothetical protein